MQVLRLLGPDRIDGPTCIIRIAILDRIARGQSDVLMSATSLLHQIARDKSDVLMRQIFAAQCRYIVTMVCQRAVLPLSDILRM